LVAILNTMMMTMMTTMTAMGGGVGVVGVVGVVVVVGGGSTRNATNPHPNHLINAIGYQSMACEYHVVA
jgi:hypothetical protein